MNIALYGINSLTNQTGEPAEVCVVELIHATSDALEFLSPVWLSAGLGIRYYVKRSFPKDSPESWWEIEVPTVREKEPPYKYTAKVLWPYKAVASTDAEKKSEDNAEQNLG